jgi:hypothetical protein
MNDVDKKLFQLQQQLERWILRSAYFLPDGDVFELYQSVQALEGVRKDLDTLNRSGLSLTKDTKSDLLPATE